MSAMLHPYSQAPRIRSFRYHSTTSLSSRLRQRTSRLREPSKAWTRSCTPRHRSCNGNPATSAGAWKKVPPQRRPSTARACSCIIS